jgi:2-methylcitrate dehydratase
MSAQRCGTGLDGQVMPEQYTPERIRGQDVQDLLKRVVVRPSDAYTARFPQEMPCLLRVALRDGRVLVKEKRDYEGFPTNPMRWETVVQKFERLSAPYTDTDLRQAIVEAVERLENLQVEELMRLLARVRA